jgi:hypothetical protein
MQEERRLFNLRELEKMLKSHYKKQNSDLEVSFGDGKFFAYVIHEKGKPWARSLTTEEAFTEIARILFPNEDVRIVRIHPDLPKVELLIEKS